MIPQYLKHLESSGVNCNEAEVMKDCCITVPGAHVLQGSCSPGELVFYDSNGEMLIFF